MKLLLAVGAAVGGYILSMSLLRRITTKGYLIQEEPLLEGKKEGVVFHKQKVIFLSPAMYSLMKTDGEETLQSLSFVDGDLVLKAEGIAI